MSTSAAAPSESVRLAMTTLSQQQQQQQSSSEQLRMMNHPVSEPLYENVQLNNGADGAGQNAAVNNSGSPETRLSVQRQSVEQPKASPDSRGGTLGSDNSCSESIDSRTAENKKSKLTKFWGRKHKVQT